MALLVDSSVLITIERRSLALSDLVRITRDEPLAAASITISELLRGVHSADTSARRNRRESFVETLVEAMPVVPFDLPAAQIHARIWADLSLAGMIIGSHDLLIAATALSRGYAVLTDNLREFERVPELKVQKPAW